MKTSTVSPARYLACVAVMTAVGTLLMYLEFSIPIMPGFIKFDFSELPPLITAYALGPVAGSLVCLFKNLFHMIGTTTAGVGELSNFLLGISLVIPAGCIYKFRKTRASAAIGAVVGSVAMALISLLVNYYITYPFYAKAFMPMEQILAAYRAIYLGVDNLWEALAIFNLPFNIAKGWITALLTFVLYKPLSPIIKGYGRHSRRVVAQSDCAAIQTDDPSTSIPDDEANRNN